MAWWFSGCCGRNDCCSHLSWATLTIEGLADCPSQPPRNCAVHNGTYIFPQRPDFSNPPEYCYFRKYRDPDTSIALTVYCSEEDPEKVERIYCTIEAPSFANFTIEYDPPVLALDITNDVLPLGFWFGCTFGICDWANATVTLVGFS